MSAFFSNPFVKRLGGALVAGLLTVIAAHAAQPATPMVDLLWQGATTAVGLGGYGVAHNLLGGDSTSTPDSAPPAAK